MPSVLSSASTAGGGPVPFGRLFVLPWPGFCDREGRGAGTDDSYDRSRDGAQPMLKFGMSSTDSKRRVGFRGGRSEEKALQMKICGQKKLGDSNLELWVCM